MGVLEAAREGIKVVLEGFYPGLTLHDILHDGIREMKRLGVQGQMELANVLYNGSAFVPYGPGQWSKPDREGGPDHGFPDKEQERGGIEI